MTRFACLLLLWVLAACAAAQIPVINRMCPVTTDQPSDPAVFVEYKGQKVYLCCTTCRKKFLAMPERYIANVHFELQGEPAVENLRPAVHARLAVSPSAISATGVERSFWNHLVGWFGHFHVVFLHLPLGLVIAAALVEIIRWLGPQGYLREVALANLTLAAVSAIPVAVFGWAAAYSGEYAGALGATLWWHRWLGTAGTFFIVGVWRLAWESRLHPGGRLEEIYRAGLFLLAAWIAITAHFGGMLVHGLDQFAW